jgi:hypothetical protein
MIELLALGFGVVFGWVARLFVVRVRTLRSLRRASGTLDEVERVMAEAQARERELEAALVLQRQRADNYFNTIAEIERERNGWTELHTRMTAEHGRAQDMMMREIQLVTVQYEQRRRAVLLALEAGDVEVARTAAAVQLRRNAALEAIAHEFGLTYLPPEALRSLGTPSADECDKIG